MKKFSSLPVIVVLIIFYGCTSKKQTIHFEPIGENEFNSVADSSFAVPHGKIWEERKKIHDSCMGSSYAANAVFMRTKDTFLMGSIVNMKTMKIVKNFDPRYDAQNFFSSAFTFTTKPCYEKRPLDIGIDSLMNNQLLLKIDSSNEKLNTELAEAIKNSAHNEIETGSWLNMEITDLLGKMLDTTTNAAALEYKEQLLNPDNMILVRSSSITEVSFYFHTNSPITPDLKNKLLSKPVINPQPNLKVQFFFIDDKSFKLTINGFFQIIGQFMKCKLE
ncbi:MAG TPA: hypothetical protein PLP23_02270 [Panacibacter sp.]|nr:hypothetical protein [Panacibacter sp.]